MIDVAKGSRSERMHVGFRFVLTVAAVLLAEITGVSPSVAEERVALLVGNQNYHDKVGALKNPYNDIELVREALQKIGFKVTAIKDADYKTFDIAIKRYVSAVRAARRGAISLFYYSGHGAANPSTQINYLIPVDVADADDNIWLTSIEQNEVIERLSRQAPDATHYVVFDACRNELRLTRGGDKALGADKGFVPIEQTAGLLIAYATAPRQTASDSGDGGGPYAKALAEEIVKPGIESVTMFRNVQLKVKQAIGQDPWLSFPTLPAIYFAGEQPPGSPPETGKVTEQKQRSMGSQEGR
jgi:uncharacterized caspase-like protein